MKASIYISGGVVQSIFSDNPSLEVQIFNEDDLLESEISQHEINRQFDDFTLGLTQIF